MHDGYRYWHFKPIPYRAFFTSFYTTHYMTAYFPDYGLNHNHYLRENRDPFYDSGFILPTYHDPSRYPFYPPWPGEFYGMFGYPTFAPRPDPGAKLLEYFKTKDGQIDVNKLIKTAGQLIGTVNQLAGTVKNVSSLFKT